MNRAVQQNLITFVTLPLWCKVKSLSSPVTIDPFSMSVYLQDIHLFCYNVTVSDSDINNELETFLEFVFFLKIYSTGSLSYLSFCYPLLTHTDLEELGKEFYNCVKYYLPINTKKENKVEKDDFVDICDLLVRGADEVRFILKVNFDKLCECLDSVCKYSNIDRLKDYCYSTKYLSIAKVMYKSPCNGEFNIIFRRYANIYSIEDLVFRFGLDSNIVGFNRIGKEKNICVLHQIRMPPVFHKNNLYDFDTCTPQYFLSKCYTYLADQTKKAILLEMTKHLGI